MDPNQAWDLLRLSAKERRLAQYLWDGGSPVIGDICRTLHTTPITLLTKTWPSLDAKLKAGSGN